MLLLALILLQAPQVILLRAADATAPVRIERVTLKHQERYSVGAEDTAVLFLLGGRAIDDKGAAFTTDDALYSSGSPLSLRAEKSATFVRFTLENATPRRLVLESKTRLLPAYVIAANKGTARIVFEPGQTGEPSWVFDILDVEAGAAVPEHQHDDAVEIILLVSGSALTMLNGKQHTESLVTIPKGVAHSASFPAKARALQLYSPAGPQERFRKAPTKP